MLTDLVVLSVSVCSVVVDFVVIVVVVVVVVVIVVATTTRIATAAKKHNNINNNINQPWIGPACRDPAGGGSAHQRPGLGYLCCYCSCCCWCCCSCCCCYSSCSGPGIEVVVVVFMVLACISVISWLHECNDRL